MTPDEFLRSIEKREPQPAYLFLGPEPWTRDRCRKALIERMLPPEDREQGLTRHDLSEVDLSEVIDDARSFSLFATRRVVWAGSAEAALPKRDTGDDAGAAMISSYLKDPPPGVVLVFDCSRYELEGDDKAKIAASREVLFRRWRAGRVREVHARLRPVKWPKDLRASAASRSAASNWMRWSSCSEPTWRASPARLKSCRSTQGRTGRVTEEDIFSLAPSAKASTIFALVNAIGRNDRPASLESLDVLVREGEYLPLALVLSRDAVPLRLVAKEARLSNASQIQAYFTKQGTPMWRSRAEQVAQTAAAFSVEKLRTAAIKIFETDRALRDARPDDRTVMERFVLELTGT